jgi:hypothetical protein
MLNYKIRLFISSALLFCLTGVFNAQPQEMSEDEYEFMKDQYAAQIINFMIKLDTLNAEIENLKLTLMRNDSILENSEADLYALVGATKSDVNDFRRKFEETEKKINNKTGTPADARKEYFDEILGSKIKCLPEFQERFISMKNKLEWAEGYEKTVPPADEGTYVVVKGDCLWKISTLKYNSPYYWPAIWEANKNGVVNKDDLPDYRHQAVTNPNLIYPGQVLKIPSINTDPVIKGEEYREKFKKYRKERLIEK